MAQVTLRLGRVALALCLFVACSAVPTSIVASREFQWKPAIATVFWVGEESSNENGHIANIASAWDRHWLAHFGGVDDPEHRCGYLPCGFTPMENPFYVALPYDDMTEDGARKTSASVVPWRGPAGKSALKNRWIAIRANGRTCYAQWQDVGPFESNDAAYVFGDALEPRNKQIAAAGIDLSPAVRDCLQVEPVSRVTWRHVEESEVPAGPWRETVTRRPGP